MSEWRDQRNGKSLARLRRALPAIFPAPVLHHALRRPFIPPTPRRAVESYWRAHPLRADRLARALARDVGAPAGWTWRADVPADGRPGGFRVPPAPYREAAHGRGPGWCCVCGAAVYRFGWHRDLWGDGRQNARASWHSACVVAWQLWSQPSEHVKLLRKAQGRRCRITGARLLRTSEVDHRVPLHQVWRAHRDSAWTDLLGYWGVPNLQVINREAHLAKTVREATSRAEMRRAEAVPQVPGSGQGSAPLP